MGPGSGEDAIVAGQRGTHADNVEEPGAERSERPGLEVVVEEGLRGFAVVLSEECGQVVAAKMMDDSGGDVDVAGEAGGEGIAVKKMARKGFGASETAGFFDQR